MNLPYNNIEVKKSKKNKAKNIRNKIEELNNELKAIELNELDSTNPNDNESDSEMNID